MMLTTLGSEPSAFGCCCCIPQSLDSKKSAHGFFKYSFQENSGQIARRSDTLGTIASLPIYDRRRPIFEKEKIRKSLIGWALLVVVICAICWAAALLTNPELENSRPLDPASSIGSVLTAVAILILLPDRWTMIFAACLGGGAIANSVERLIGPVNDYILLPGGGGQYANIADMLITLAPMFLVIYIVTLSAERIRMRRRGEIGWGP